MYHKDFFSGASFQVKTSLDPVKQTPRKTDLPTPEVSNTNFKYIALVTECILCCLLQWDVVPTPRSRSLYINECKSAVLISAALFPGLAQELRVSSAAPQPTGN